MLMSMISWIRWLNKVHSKGRASPYGYVSIVVSEFERHGGVTGSSVALP